MTAADDFEVIDLDSPTADRYVRPPSRPLGAGLVLAVVVVAAALLTAAGTWYAVASRPHHVTRTVQPDVYNGADAGGCPATGRCTPDAAQFTAVDQAVTRWFPDAVVQSDHATSDPSLNRTYRSTIVFSSARVLLVLVVQCVPGGSAVPARGSPPSGGSVAGPVVLTLTEPGPQQGCSTSVTAEVPAGATAPTGAMRSLSGDPSVYD